MVLNLINRISESLGLRISKISGQDIDQSLDFKSVFSRLNGRALPIETVVDVGASSGIWSKKILSVYPKAFYLLIEANAHHEEGLKQFRQKQPDSDYVLAVAGESEGEIYFDQSDPFGGVASPVKTETCNTRLPCVSVDGEVAKRKLRGPFLLKLDTHGFEVPIFNGAVETLKKTNLIFVETYNFDIEKNSLRFWEICQFLFEKGFRPIDLCEPMHRPKDGAFWQIDILLVRNDSEEFRSNKYE